MLSHVVWQGEIHQAKHQGRQAGGGKEYQGAARFFLVMEGPRRESHQSSRFGSEYLVCAIRLTPPRISQRERR